MNNGCIQTLAIWSLLLVVSRQISGEKKCLEEQPTCVCTYNRVDCSDRQIDAIPLSFPNTTKQIYLNGNNITVVKQGAFHGLATLTSINLFKNKISYIESNAFYNLSFLEDIVLKNNSLQEILPKTFHALKTLSDIYLQNNKISVINTEAFVALPKLRSIYLDGNNIHCTCAVEWFVQYLTKNPMISQRSTITCAYPPDLAGKDITHLNRESRQCDLKPSTVLRKEVDSTSTPSFYVVVGLVSGIIISTVSILLLRKRKCQTNNPNERPAAAARQSVNASNVFAIGDQMVLTSSVRGLMESSIDNVAYHSSASTLYEPMWSPNGYSNMNRILQKSNSNYQDVANTCTDGSKKSDQ